MNKAFCENDHCFSSGVCGRMRRKIESSCNARLPVVGWAGLSVVLVLAGVLNFKEAAVASFDCANANGDIDKVVCNDPELSELDELVVSYYESASATLTNARRQALSASQRNWLQDQSKCTGSMIRQCLFKRYKARLLLLEVQYGRGTPPSRSFIAAMARNTKLMCPSSRPTRRR